MAALISWVCRADHPAQERSEYVPMITVNEGNWAFCLRGGDSEHKWDAIDPAPVESLRFRRNIAPEASIAAVLTE